MPRVAKPLGALAVKNLSGKGLHSVGGVSGLYLSISNNSSKSWILRTKIGNRRSDIGLGSYPAISLSLAQSKATTTKESIKQGNDPIAERRHRKNLVEWTFRRCAFDYIESHRDGWKNVKHAQQWENTLETYAMPFIGNMHVRDIGVREVLLTIEPQWRTKNVTMDRVRNRIELVLAWASVRGYRSKDNPATWRGNLDKTLLKPSKANKVKPHTALPFKQINSFVQTLRLKNIESSKCLEWLILTASRSGEARGTRWCEIDLKSACWTVPAERMKAGREHKVPLSSSAIHLLNLTSKNETNDLLFGGSNDKPLSDMTLSQAMRRMKVNAVPHGFRSTFTDWAAETTNHPQELREMALAHSLGDRTREAYQRGELFERRRQLMEDWANYIETKINK